MLLFLLGCFAVDHHTYTTATVSSVAADAQGFYAVVDRTTYERTTWSGGESTSVEAVDGVIVRCVVSGDSVSCRPLISTDDVASAATAPVNVGTSSAPSLAALATPSTLLAQLWTDAGRAHAPVTEADLAAVYARQSRGSTVRDLRDAATKAGATLSSTATMDEILTAGGLPCATAKMVTDLYAAAGREAPKNPALDQAVIGARMQAGQTYVQMLEAAKKGGQSALNWAGLDGILSAGGLPTVSTTP